ncbi:MAG: hypothetical protein IJ916_04745 [Paludibacteraceae bacterium]|nr:hypothetical protein [Paludibacteraceae bacterium]
MKKLLLVVAAFFAMNAFAQEQGDDNGFGLKLGVGFGGSSYGTVDYGSVIKIDGNSNSYSPAFGLSLDNRWYVANPGKFGIAIDARWLDLSIAHFGDKTDYTEVKSNLVKFEMFGPGVIGTFYINDKMAADLYWNIIPSLAVTGHDSKVTTPAFGNNPETVVETEDTDFALGMSNYIGAAFRFKVFQAGVEYNIAKLKYQDWGKNDDNAEDVLNDWANSIFGNYKQNLNNFRVFVGFKF